MARKRAAVTAPAISVLNETLRPVRASAGIAEQIVKGHPERAPGAAVKGLVHNKGPTYGKLLRDAGAPKGVAAVAGFALDVALDPTTYVTAGASVPARKAAEAAARKATADALAKGASRKVADRAGRAAAKVKLADPKLQNKGLTVGVRAKVPFTKKPQIDVKTSGKTTAAISRKTGLSKAATKVRESPKVQAIGESIVHDFRPKGVSRQGHERVRAAQREYRAEVAQTRRQAERQNAALRKLIPDPDTSKLIIDHIQAGRPLRELGEHADTARAVKQILGRSFDAKKQAGLLHGPYRPRPTKLGEKTLKAKAATLKVERYGPSTDAKGYIPGVRRIDLEPGRKGVIPSRRVGVAKVAREQGKTFREPLAVYRKTMPHVFSEDLPAILTHSVTKSHEKVAVANLWQKIAKTGRPLNPQTAKNIDLTDEMVFEVTPHGLVPLVKKGTDKAPDLAAIAKASETGGRHVILNRDSTMKLIEGSKNQQLPIGRVFDRAQGYWKTAVTATPGFHVRNLVGDTQNAYLADTTAAAYNQARRLLVAKAHRNKGERKSVATVDTTPKLTIGNTTKTERQWIREAEQHGAIDQGFMGAEVASQANRSPGKIMRGLQYREDLPRLATYLSGRERGMTPSQASEHVAKHHFDYGDLTATERATRRYAIPFWTFFARNTRLQATKVITRPGKVATLGKFMEESAQLAGFKDYESFAQDLPDYQQRGLPIPIKTGDKVTAWTWAPPATDLNALTVSPTAFAQNVAQRLTAAKLIGELYLNKSIFFQGDIEHENARLVPAPQILGSLPEDLRKHFGIEKFRDKRRGMIWGWPGKTDYIARQTPQTNVLVQALTPVPGSRGKSGAQAATGMLTGFKPQAYAASVEDEAVRRASDKLHKLNVEKSNLLKTPKAKDADGYASPQLVKLRKQIKAQEQVVKDLKDKRGDDTSEQRIELSPADRMKREFEEFTDPKAQQRKLVEEFEAFAKGRP
jgi:hypothetical protein